MTVLELAALAGVGGIALYLATRKSATAMPVAAPTGGGLIGGSLSGNAYVAAGQVAATAIFHPGYVNQVVTGVPQGVFQTFGDSTDFDKLMSNAHACQTGNQAACEAVYEQSPDMVCTPQFCDQDPTKNNGHGSAVDLGGGTFSYHMPGNVPSIAHYGKKVPIGGCRTTGRKWDTGGAANATSNINAGYCAGLL